MCDFEDPDACDVTITSQSNEFRFEQTDAAKLSSVTSYGPMSDHSTGTSQGKFVAAVSKKPDGTSTQFVDFFYVVNIYKLLFTTTIVNSNILFD